MGRIRYSITVDFAADHYKMQVQVAASLALKSKISNFVIQLVLDFIIASARLYKMSMNKQPLTYN